MELHWSPAYGLQKVLFGYLRRPFASYSRHAGSLLFFCFTSSQCPMCINISEYRYKYIDV